MKLTLLVIFAFVNVYADDANDKDVAHWKEEAEKNVNKDLDKWSNIVNSGDHKQMHLQLENLQSQILTACNNMKVFVPVLGKAIETIHYLGSDSNSTVKGTALIGAVKLLHGKRDNKSYYLLDGAHNWIAKRVDAMKAKEAALASKLQELDTKVVALREELDSSAGKFVKSLNELYELIKDTKANADQIKKVSQEMYDNYQGSGQMLKNNQALEDQVNKIVSDNP